MAPRGSGGEPSGPSPGSGGRPAALVGSVVICLALVVAVVAVDASSDDRDGGIFERATSAGEGGRPDDLEADASPAEVFAHAARILDEAGTFSYEGSSRIEGPDPFSGASSMVIERDLDGAVVLPDSVRETVDDPQGLVTERISIGTGTAVRSWMRNTAYDAQIDERPWGEFDGASGELELYLLPDWLEGAVDHRDGGEDANGRRVVHAGVPARLINDLGTDVSVIDVAVQLTLGGDGEPQLVVLTVSTRDTVVEATYELTALGSGVTIEAPTADELDATPWFNEQDLAAFDGPAPLGLSGVPEGWELSAAYVMLDPVSGCPSASVDYTDLDEPVDEYLWLQVYAAECAPAPSGEPLEVAGYVGAVDDAADGSRWGVVVSGDTAVSFTTDLSVGDLRLVLATLSPLDLAATPSPLDGIPSSGT